MGDDADQRHTRRRSDGARLSPAPGLAARRAAGPCSDAQDVRGRVWSQVPWKAYEHPDFPGKKVEVGGFAPNTKTNPPEKLLAELTARHGKFLTDLAAKLPRIGIRKAEAKHLGESVFDVTVQVENTGYLPTMLAQGGLTREVHPTRVVLKTDQKFLLSGDRTTMLNAIQAGELKEVRWVVRAKGAKKLDVEVISMLAGRTQASIELKEEVK